MQTNRMNHTLRCYGVDIDADNLLREPTRAAAELYAKALTLTNIAESLTNARETPASEEYKRFADAQFDTRDAAAVYRAEKGITNAESAAVYRRAAAEALPHQ